MLVREHHSSLAGLQFLSDVQLLFVDAALHEKCFSAGCTAR